VTTEAQLRAEQQLNESLVRLIKRYETEAPRWLREIQASLADLDDRLTRIERAYNDAQRLEEIGGLS
jgi:hypothetical protein